MANPLAEAHLPVEGQQELLPDATLLHSSEVIIDGLPWRKMRRQHPPLAAGLVDIHDGIDDLALGVLAHRSTRIRTLGPRFNQGPLLIGQIRRIPRTLALKLLKFKRF